MKKILSFVLALVVCASYVLGSTCTAEAFDVELYDNTIKTTHVDYITIHIVGTDPSGTIDLSEEVVGEMRDEKLLSFDIYKDFDKKGLGKSAGMVPVFYTEPDGGGTKIERGTDISSYIIYSWRDTNIYAYIKVYVKWVSASEYFSGGNSLKVKIKKITCATPYEPVSLWDQNVTRLSDDLNKRHQNVTMLLADWSKSSVLATDYIIKIKYPGKSKYKTLGEKIYYRDQEPSRIRDAEEYIPTTIKGFIFKKGFYSSNKFCKGKYSEKPITGTYTIKITPVYYGVKGPTITKKYKLK